MGLCASSTSSASAASVAPVPPRSPPEPRSSSSAAALTEARTVTHGAAGVGIPVSPDGCLQPSPAAGAAAAAQSPSAPPEGLAAEALVAAAVGSGGAPAVLALMRAQPQALALQGWCCDALAGLMSGAAEVRAAAAGEGALALVLGALARFPYAEEVQARGCWVLAALAAGHAGEAGEGGALEACAAALRACPEAYTVLAAAVRAASNLVAAPPPAGPANAARAVALGLAAALKAALAAHPHDGQLQWRCQQLLGRLAAAAAAAAPAAAGGEGGGAGASGSAASSPAQAARGAQSPPRRGAQRRPSLLAPLVMVLLPEHSAEAPPAAAAPAAAAAAPAPAPAPAPAAADALSALGAALRASQEANLPGREGPSLLVAQARQRGGVHELCMLLGGLASELEGETPGGAPDAAREAGVAGAGAGGGARAAGARAQRAVALEASAETAYWCCEELSDAMRQDKSARLRAVLEDGVPSLFTLLRVRPYDERLALACLVALQAIAGDVNLSAQVGLGIEGIVGALEANKMTLAVQQAGIKLISLLLLEPTGANLAAARASSAARAVKAIVSAHAADAQLLYRGINILERLEAGSSAGLPPQCSGAVRSESMRSEEAVREGQAAAASFVAAGSPLGGSSSFRESRRLGGASARGVKGGLAQGLGRSSRSTLLPHGASSRRALDSTSSTVTSGELTTAPSARLLQCKEGEKEGEEEEAGREGSSGAPSGAPPASAQVGVN